MLQASLKRCLLFNYICNFMGCLLDCVDANIFVTKEYAQNKSQLRKILRDYGNNISILDIDKIYNVELTSSGNVTVSYSPLTYIMQAQKACDMQLIQLTKAMYFYYMAASGL